MTEIKEVAKIICRYPTDLGDLKAKAHIIRGILNDCGHDRRGDAQAIVAILNEKVS